MALAQTPFVVFFLERSGSSHLCSLLDSHPEICCGAEEFTTRSQPGISPHESPRHIHSRERKISDPDSDQVQSHLQCVFSRCESAAGLKFKFPIQFDRYPQILEWLNEKREQVSVIHLDRENLLRKFISKQVLVHRRSADPEFRRNGKATSEPVPVDVDDMLETLQRFESQRQNLKQLVSEFPRRLEIEYERFNDDPETLMTKTLSFLGVDVGVQLQSKFSKKTASSIEKTVANFDEMCAAIKGSEFEYMLQL